VPTKNRGGWGRAEECVVFVWDTATGVEPVESIARADQPLLPAGIVPARHRFGELFTCGIILADRGSPDPKGRAHAGGASRSRGCGVRGSAVGNPWRLVRAAATGA
jgi:hypothetical protein